MEDIFKKITYEDYLRLEDHFLNKGERKFNKDIENLKNKWKDLSESISNIDYLG